VDGNPWYLTTSAAAEQLYYALAQWDKAESLEVTDVSLAFFKDVSQSEVATGQYEKGSNEYKTLTAAVRRRADGYLSIVQRHTPENGAMSEQFSKTDGTPLAAPDLTWSYAALLTAKAARDGNLPPVWGADGATGSEC
jgi:glucoamylase